MVPSFSRARKADQATRSHFFLSNIIMHIMLTSGQQATFTQLFPLLQFIYGQDISIKFDTILNLYDIYC